MKFSWCVFALSLSCVLVPSAHAAEADFGWLAEAAVESSDQVATADVDSESGDITIEADLPDRPGSLSGGWNDGVKPVEIRSAQGFSGWAIVDFGAAGTLSWRLVDRVAASDVLVGDGSSSVQNDVIAVADAADPDLLSVAIDGGVEEFVLIDQSARDEVASLTYELVLPEGARLVESESGASVLTENGDVLIRLSAPFTEAVDSGDRVTNSIEVDPAAGMVTIAPDNSIEALSGDVVIDPAWQTTSATGHFNKAWCPNAGGCNPGAVGADISRASNSQFVMEDHFNYGWRTYAPYNVASHYHGASAYGTMRYYPGWSMPGVYVDAVSSNLYVNNPANVFKCAMEMDYVGTGTTVGSGSFSTYWDPTSNSNWVGTRFWTDTSVIINSDANRCSTETAGTHYLTAMLYDAWAPTVGSPGTPAAAIGIAAAQAYRPQFISTDSMSGVAYRRWWVNGYSPYNWIWTCSYSDQASRPCSTSVDIQSPQSAELQSGKNTVYWQASDYAGHIVTGSPQTITVDTAAPLAPSITWAIQDTESGKVRTYWTGGDTPQNNAFDATLVQSELSNYAEVCISATSASCTNWTAVTAADPNVAPNYAETAVTPLPTSPTTLWMFVRARDRVGLMSANSAPFAVSVGPVVPQVTGLDVAQISGRHARAQWTPTVSPSGEQTFGYDVCASQTATDCPAAAMAGLSDGFTRTNNIDLDLSSGTWYVRVVAKNQLGMRGLPSDAKIFTVDATPPTITGLAATTSLRSNSAAALAPAVTDASGVNRVEFAAYNEAGAIVEQSVDSISPFTASFSTSTTSFATDGEYRIGASAWDLLSNGSSASGGWHFVCLDRATLPQPSSVEHAFAGSPVSSARVVWVAPSSTVGVAGFIVERRPNSTGAWSKIALLSKAARTFVDSSATTTSEYRVETFGQSCTTTARGNGVASTAVASTSTTGDNGSISVPRIGLEDRWETRSEDLGAGAEAIVDVAGGNVAIRKPLPSTAGRGFDLNPTLTWNSQDQSAHDDLAFGGVLGKGWTLGLSSLTPGSGVTSFTGVALEALRVNGTALTLRDDDGTPHTFDQPSAGVYQSPPGTWLYVRDIASTGESAPSWATNAKFAATRPDRVTFWYADHVPGGSSSVDGRLLGVSDRNGARLLVEYQCIQVNAVVMDVATLATVPCTTQTPSSGYVLRNRPSAVKDAENRTLSLQYFDETSGASTRNQDGRLKSLTDPASVKTSLQYDRVGTSAVTIPRLVSILEGDTTPSARSTQLQVSATDDTSSPWIDESLLYSLITDPRGEATTLRYVLAERESLARARSITDRQDRTQGGALTQFSYSVNDTGGGATAVRDEAGVLDGYYWDEFGRVTHKVDPSGLHHRYEYTSSHRMTASHRILRDDEQVTLLNLSPATLAETAIDGGTEVVVRSAADGAGVMYDAVADYELNRVTGQLARTSGSLIPSGSTVYVTYRYSSQRWTWDPSTGLNLTSAAPEPRMATSGGAEAPTSPGAMAPSTDTTYTNSAFGGRVKDVSTITSPRGSATSDGNDFMTSYSYDPQLRLVGTARPINAGSGDATDIASQSYTYYSNGTLQSQTDETGVTTAYGSYDLTGRPQIVYVPVVGAFNLGTAIPDTVTIRDAAGRTTCTDDKREAGDGVSSPLTTNACVFAASNRRFETTTYDALGRETVSTRPWDETRRRATATTYDPNGNATSVVDHIGFQGGATSADPATPGVQTTTSFDPLDRATATTLPSNGNSASRVQKSTYDAADRPAMETEPLGAATDDKYDYATRHHYDSFGREVRTVNGNGEVTCTYYDRLGRVSVSTSPMAVGSADGPCPSSAPTSWDTRTAYDRADNAATATDESDRTTSTYFDVEGDAIRTVDPAGEATVTTPDAEGGARIVAGPARLACASSVTCTSQDVSSPTTITSTTFGSGSTQTTVIEPRQATEGGSTMQYALTSTTTATATGQETVTSLPQQVGDIARQTVSTQSEVTGGSTSTVPTDATVTSGEKRVNSAGPDGAVLTEADNAAGTTTTYTYTVYGQPKTKTQGSTTINYTYNADASLATEWSMMPIQVWEPNKTFAAGACIAPTSTSTSYYMVVTGGLTGSGTPKWGSFVRSKEVELISSTCAVTTSYTYDLNGVVSVKRETSPGWETAQVTTWKTRDRVGRPIEVSHNGVNTYFTYDLNGNVLTRTHKGVQTTNVWGSAGAETGKLVRTGLGAVGNDFGAPTGPHISASFTYDTAGRLATVARKGTDYVKTQYARDRAGEIVRIVTCVQPTESAACVSGGVPQTSNILQDASYALDIEGSVRVEDEQVRSVPLQVFALNTAYAVGDIVRPQSRNGHRYLVTAAGTTAGSSPVWPTTAGSTVASGGATFAETSMNAVDVFADSVSLGIGDLVRPTVQTGHEYVVTVAGTTGTEPAWPDSTQGEVTSGGVTFRENTAHSAFAYDGEGRLTLEDRPEDPRPAVDDATRSYSYNQNGQLQLVKDASCTSGTATLESRQLGGAQGQVLQLDARTEFAVTNASGACTATATNSDDVSYGAASTAGEGSIVSVTHDLVSGADSVDRFDVSSGRLYSVTTKDTTSAIQIDAAGSRRKVVREIDSVSATVTYSFDGVDSEPAGTEEGGVIAVNMRDPDGRLIGQYRVGASSRYMLNDRRGIPVAELTIAAAITARRSVDYHLTVVNLSGVLVEPEFYKGMGSIPGSDVVGGDYIPDMMTSVTAGGADELTDLYGGPSAAPLGRSGREPIKLTRYCAAHSEMCAVLFQHDTMGNAEKSADYEYGSATGTYFAQYNTYHHLFWMTTNAIRLKEEAEWTKDQIRSFLKGLGDAHEGDGSSGAEGVCAGPDYGDGYGNQQYWDCMDDFGKDSVADTRNNAFGISLGLNDAVTQQNKKTFIFGAMSRGSGTVAIFPGGYGAGNGGTRRSTPGDVRLATTYKNNH